jgi:excisionase family DNA binding protein
MSTTKHNKTQPEPLLTQAELARVLGVHIETISRLTVSKRIPFIWVGRRAKRYELEAVVIALASKPNKEVKEVSL